MRALNFQAYYSLWAWTCLVTSAIMLSQLPSFSLAPEDFFLNETPNNDDPDSSPTLFLNDDEFYAGGEELLFSKDPHSLPDIDNAVDKAVDTAVDFNDAVDSAVDVDKSTLTEPIPNLLNLFADAPHNEDAALLDVCSDDDSLPPSTPSPFRTTRVRANSCKSNHQPSSDIDVDFAVGNPVGIDNRVLTKPASVFSGLLADMSDGNEDAALPDACSNDEFLSSSLSPLSSPPSSSSSSSSSFQQIAGRANSCKSNVQIPSDVDIDFGGIDSKRVMTTEEIKKYWCTDFISLSVPENFGKIPVCYGPEGEGLSSSSGGGPISSDRGVQFDKSVDTFENLYNCVLSKMIHSNLFHHVKTYTYL